MGQPPTAQEYAERAPAAERAAQKAEKQLRRKEIMQRLELPDDGTAT